MNSNLFLRKILEHLPNGTTLSMEYDEDADIHSVKAVNHLGIKYSGVKGRPLKMSDAPKIIKSLKTYFEKKEQ